MHLHLAKKSEKNVSDCKKELQKKMCYFFQGCQCVSESSSISQGPAIKNQFSKLLQLVCEAVKYQTN
jgi:hypothetical protein